MYFETILDTIKILRLLFLVITLSHVLAMIHFGQKHVPCAENTKQDIFVSKFDLVLFGFIFL